MTNSYYEEFDCSDPLSRIVPILMTSPKEELEIADWLAENLSNGYSRKLAKALYLKNEYSDKFVALAQASLNNSTENYWQLIQYCEANGQHEKAICLGIEAVNLSKDRSWGVARKGTAIITFLILNAYHAGEMTQAKDLYMKAKRRSAYNITQVSEALRAKGIDPAQLLTV